MPRDAHTHPRDLLMQTMERIYRYRMTTTSGGNLSIRDDQEQIWITPARVDKGMLTRNDIVSVGADGQTVGPHPPSSEFPFHRAIYEARPDLRAVVHAHPVALVAFSISHKTPNTHLFHQAHELCGKVGFAPYALPGSAQLGANIARTFAEGYNCVVLENHGVVVGGDNLATAFQRFETLEFTAKTVIKAALLGEVRYLDEDQLQLPAALPRLPEAPIRPPTSAEKEVRRQLREFVHRGYRQRLLISTQGSFSARLDDQSFLITPRQSDRLTLDLDELVVVRDGCRDEGRDPSRAARLHQAIYAMHPRIQAIVNANPVNATAFSVTGTPFEARTIPESYLFLRDVQFVRYGAQFQRETDVARRLGPDQPIAILENDGVLVCGTTVLDAFDRLEVLESTAEAIINSRPLGPVATMSDEVIRELVQAFFS